MMPILAKVYVKDINYLAQYIPVIHPGGRCIAFLDGAEQMTIELDVQLIGEGFYKFGHELS